MSSSKPTKKGILERLEEGVVVGDGGFVFALEKRGYVKAGPWTPEACIEHPEAVRQLHREFLRAGSDVMQAFTFYASDAKLDNRGNLMNAKYTGENINKAACDLARSVADEGDALVAGGLSQTPTYLNNEGEAKAKAQFEKQIKVFVDNKVDFLICEYFEHVEEMVWAIETCKKVSKLPIAATMCIGPEGDLNGVSAGDCAVRMAKTGADIVGINCHFDPFMSLECIKKMKDALSDAGLKVHLMCQPLGYMTPDTSKQGFIDLAEFPFALESRVCTRFDIEKYARQAYDMGIRYIGGCCGFEAYHIRAVCQELEKERGKMCPAADKYEYGGTALRTHTKPWVRQRANKDYWTTMQPASGRPFSASMSKNHFTGLNKSGDPRMNQNLEE
jgi:betaine-homocysteine S-methyltransferase